MTASPPILLVGPGFSQHTARHANVLADGGMDVHLVSMSAAPISPDLSPKVTVHRGPDAVAGQATVVTSPHDDILRGFGIEPVADVPWLAATIDRLSPALVSSLTIQYGGYPVLLARELLGDGCPPWLVGNWGADVHYWATVPGHAGPIRDVLRGADYLFAICQRDVGLSRTFGFTGEVVAVESPGGGWDLTATARWRADGATSSRRDLVVKGYDGPVGRASVALRAVEIAAESMAGRRLVIVAQGEHTAEMAHEVGSRTGIEVVVRGHMAYEDVLRTLGGARTYVGLSVTDALPTMALEAILMGAFPIQSDTSAMEEVLKPGYSGLLVPAEDAEVVAAAIRRAMTDDQFVDDGVAWNDRFAVPRFDAATLNPRIVGAYRRVLDAQPRRRLGRAAVNGGGAARTTQHPASPRAASAGASRRSVGDCRERLPARTLVVTPVAPPDDSGQAVVLDRLLRSVHPDDYRLLVFEMGRTAPPVVAQQPLPARTVVVPPTWRPGDAASAMRDGHAAAAEIARRARLIAAVAADQGCKVILATSGLLPSLPAGVLAGRMARIPVVIHMFDHWQLQSVNGFDRTVGRLVEPWLLRAAAAVVVPNELLADAVQRTSGVRPVVVRNPIDDAALADRVAAPWPEVPGKLRVGYTGQVYEAQADSLRRVVEALKEPGLEGARLHVHAHQGKTSLERVGIAGPVVVHPFLPPPQIYAVHRESDVLILPLAFGGVYRDIIRSSSTTKLADYLASGRPVLVHAPTSSFPAWYAARHDCGLVVDTPSPKAVAAALRRLVDDPPLRQRLGEAGLRQARADFGVDRSRRRLAEVLAAAVEGRCVS